MPINTAGLQLLKKFEDFRPFPYPDPASPLGRAVRDRRWGLVPPREILAELPDSKRALSGAPWTIGYGFTKGASPDSPSMTEAEASQRLAAELRHYVAGVERCLTRPANENQLAAMVVLAFNIGIDGFARSTVCRAHNAGDFEAAARAFALWNKANGQVMAGLVRRRAAEAALYLEPVLQLPEFAPIERARPDLPELMPQTVDPERPMHRSRIVQASTVSGGVAGLTLAAEGARAVGEIRYSLGDWLPYIALGVVIIAAGWAIYERIKQRKGGWA